MRNSGGGTQRRYTAARMKQPMFSFCPLCDELFKSRGLPRHKVACRKRHQ